MRPVRPIRDPSRRTILSLGLGVPLLSLAGCSGSDPAYYTVTPWPGPVLAGGPLTVELRTPSVAAYLDRDNIVRNDKDYRLKIASDAAWATNLPDMIGRTLALDLGQRLPDSNVYTQSGAISTEALALVELDVSRFLQDEQGRAEIEAMLSVYRPNSGPTGSRHLKFTRMPADGSIRALVAALSQLLGQVADAAAEALHALPPSADGAKTG